MSEAPSQVPAAAGAAAQYFCDLCDAPRDTEVCPECNLPTRPTLLSDRAAEPPEEDLTPALDPTPTRIFQPPSKERLDAKRRGETTEPAGADEPPKPEPTPNLPPKPEPAAKPFVPPPPPPGAPPPAAEKLPEVGARTRPIPQVEEPDPLAGQGEIEEYLAKGFEVLLIVGVAGAGKTELLEAFRGSGNLTAAKRRDGRAIPTPPRGLECYPFVEGKRRFLFIDASGEYFQRLQVDPLAGREILPRDVHFLRVISKRLRGLVLLLNLAGQWDERAQQMQRGQAQVLRNILLLLRWIQGGGKYDPEAALALGGQVDSQAKTMKRLAYPVQLLFSHADELGTTRLPTRPDDSWMGTAAERRRLFPVGEEPLLLAHHYLPKLLHALEDHVHHFRVDFVHSLQTDPDPTSDKVLDPEGCGVELARDWLVAASRRRPLVATRHWLSLQRRIDRLLRRGDRWLDLPPPRGLGGRRRDADRGGSP
ncbi:MAG: hypothetical protein AAGD06_14305 [Acidobacteriota bacterium]